MGRRWVFRSKRPDTSDKYNRLYGWLDLKAACPVRLRGIGPVTFQMLMRTFYYRRSTPFLVLARWGRWLARGIDFHAADGIGVAVPFPMAALYGAVVHFNVISRKFYCRVR